MTKRLESGFEPEEPATSVVHLDETSLISQRELFPLRTIAEYPEVVTGADAWGRALCTDSHEYILKGVKGGIHVPACEWLASHLAEKVNLGCATPKIVQLDCGDIVFGSRVISGVADQATTTAILMSKTIGDGCKPIRGLATLLAEIFTFDMFINNVDRHDQNYLSIDDDGVRRFFLVDFGRSLLWGDDLSDFPHGNQPTILTGRMLRQFHGFDLEASKIMMDKIASIGVDDLAYFVKSMPSEWLPLSAKQSLLAWWKDARLDKLLRLRKGFEDGSLL